jgi:PAS domain S-box-containing protein
MNAHDRVNILLVDDQPAKLLSYEVILADLNENLIRAASAREALEVLLKNDVAVILVDVCMPELDGFELVRMLRQHPRYEKTAVIFISAVQISDADRIRGYETGAVDYVPVPVIPEILRAKVRIFVELHRKSRELEKLNNELERRVSERTGELEASTAQLRESEERLRLASEAAEFGTYGYRADGGEVYWSPYLRRVAGLGEDESLTLERAFQFVHPEHRDMVRQHVAGYSADSDRRELEFKLIRGDGETRWFLDRGQSILVDDEPGWRIVGTVLDITERKLAEERQTLLMGELDHRVKNILSNVSAIARLSSQRATSVEGFVMALDGRIQAMSSAHSLVRRAEWGGADLHTLVTEVLAAFRSRARTNIEISGDPVFVVPELTQSLALIMHELATNAVKYGALSTPSGTVAISWSRIDANPPRLRLMWHERGGPSIAPPTQTGFGLTVLNTAAQDLGARALCEFEPSGLIYTLEGPFEAAQGTPGFTSIAGRESDDIEPSHTNGKGRRILVVEDEGLIALQLQSDLEDAGHRVIGPARSLAQGLLLAEQEDIDAALVDVTLGAESSIPIANRLLARSVPFAFATGYADSTMLPEHLRGIPRLNKPYAPTDIRRIVEGLVARVGHA